LLSPCGRICILSAEDPAQQQIVLRHGLPLIFYSEEVEVDGVVQYSADENLWVAVIDWRALRIMGSSAIPAAAQTPQQHHGQ
jgi:hypothetical protein